MLHLDDTIAAIATPTGEGGIGIVRISGADSFAIADRLSPRNPTPPSRRKSHTLCYSVVCDPATGEPVDDAVLLLFRGPRSYTGEDVVEVSCHGGPVTVARVLALALRCGARAAEPGEFTRRAFLNGRMDLSQAEAVCDQIRAKTEAAQRLAVRQREGALSREISRIRSEVVGALAAVEVTIDFSEEVGDLDYGAITARLTTIGSDLQRLLDGAGQGRVYREGVRLAIVGRPNVGKSSLLNTLLGTERAIVTSIAGTTRDVIEETANIHGIPIVAIDTAGIRHTADPVEVLGVQRARAAAQSATVVLFVVDAAVGWTPEDARIATELGSVPVVIVLNKSDLVTPTEAESLVSSIAGVIEDAAIATVSALTGERMHELHAAVAERILGGRLTEESALVSNVRHERALEEARESLLQAERTASSGMPPDFISIDLRAALDALGSITGETATDEVIHRIFHDFCIGK